MTVMERLGSPSRVSDETYRSGILRDQRIGDEQGNAFDHRLRNRHPVKGILVNDGQTFHFYRMFAADGKLAIAVIQQPSTQQSHINLKVITPQTSA